MDDKMMITASGWMMITGSVSSGSE